jgi:hypothetical protein
MLCATAQDAAPKHRQFHVWRRFGHIYSALQQSRAVPKTEPPLFFHYTLTGVLLP